MPGIAFRFPVAPPCLSPSWLSRWARSPPYSPLGARARLKPIEALSYE